MVLRWTSPIRGPIKILGRFSDMDNGGGDGVRWKIMKNGVTFAGSNGSGAVAWAGGSGDGDVFLLTTSVAINDTIDFVVDAGPNNDHFYDTTDLDVLITALPKK